MLLAELDLKLRLSRLLTTAQGLGFKSLGLKLRVYGAGGSSGVGMIFPDKQARPT